MRAALALAALALAGCNVILGIEDLSGPQAQVDAPLPPTDVPVDVLVPDQITITGMMQIVDFETGGMPGSNVPIQFFRLPDRARLGETISDRAGNFTISLPTDGNPVDGYFVMTTTATMNNVPVSAVYNNGFAFVGDTSFGLFAFTSTTIDQLAAQVGEPQGPNAMFVFVQIVQDMGQIGNSGHPGATVMPEPFSRVYYTNNGFFPDPNTMATSPDGVAYIFDAPPTPTILRLGGSATGEAFVDLGTPVDGQLVRAHFMPFRVAL